MIRNTVSLKIFWPHFGHFDIFSVWSTLIYSPLIYSTHLYFTPHHSTLLYFTLPYSPSLNSTLLRFSLLYYIPLYSTLLYYYSIDSISLVAVGPGSDVCTHRTCSRIHPIPKGTEGSLWRSGSSHYSLYKLFYWFKLDALIVFFVSCFAMFIHIYLWQCVSQYSTSLLYEVILTSCNSWWYYSLLSSEIIFTFFKRKLPH